MIIEEETETPVEPEEPALPTTPEEIVDLAYGLAEGETTEVSYTLTGVITSIDTAWSDRYGNITVTIQIGDMADKLIKCYRLAGEGAATLKVGDTITVTGVFTNYKGTIEFAQGCTLDAVVPGPEVEPEEPVAGGVTITFADHTYRTEEGSNYQVFTNGDFTFTQAQAGSNNWNTTYIDPIRLYVGHEITIAYAGMTKIVVECNSPSYATALVTALEGCGATVEDDGNVVTITFSAATDSIVFTPVKQVRVNAITVC